MLRIFITTGILLVVINSFTNGQIFPESQFFGYPNDAPSNSYAFSKPTTQRLVDTKVSGYIKEAPSNPLEYPVKTTTLRPTTSRPTTARLAGYEYIAPSNPLVIISPVETTRRPTTAKPTTPRPTTPRPTTPRPTTPRPTTARLAGYEYKAPSNPLVIISPVETTRRPTTARPTTPRPTTPRPTSPRPTTPRPTTARLAGYEYKAPSNPLEIISPVEKPQGYPRIVPDNPLVYNSISDNLIGSASIQQLYISPAGEESKLLLESASEDGRYHSDADHTHWDIRKSIPGEPGTDYPVLDEIPLTKFACDDKIQGYYADMETECQVFHVCTLNSRSQKKSFLCPNGTIFNQELLICDWWSNVNCAASEIYYSRQPSVNKKTTTISKKSGNQL